MSAFDLFGFALVALALLTIANQLLHLVVGVRNDYLHRQVDFKKFKSRVATFKREENSNQNLFPSWQGYRNFTVEKKIIENSNCVSIHLTPQDGQAITLSKAGQFIKIKATPFEQAIVRSYSLSSFNDENYYRITVKRQEQHGILSNYICDYLSVGDVIQCKMPAGDFTIDNSEHDIVFIAAGIGITPILAMLKQLSIAKSQKQIYLFWGVSALGDVILSEDFENLAKKLPNLKMHLFISQSGKSTSKNVEDTQFAWLQKEGKQDKYILSKDENIIGNSKHSQVTIDRPEVTSSHVSIINRNNQWFIRDLGSTAGTVLNKRQIGGVKAAWRSFPLKNRDKIEIAEVTFIFYSPINASQKRDEGSERRDKLSIKDFTLHKGRISKNRVGEFIESKNYTTYLSGPAPLIEDYCSSEINSTIKVESFNEQSTKAINRANKLAKFH